MPFGDFDRDGKVSKAEWAGLVAMGLGLFFAVSAIVARVCGG